MMPRYFNSIADAVVATKGAKARAAYTAAQREAKRAEMSNPAAVLRAYHRDMANEDLRLLRAATAAEDHLAKLRGKLAAARSQLANMVEAAYKSGDIRVDAAKVKAQVDGLPDLIVRAERQLADARDTLAAHRARVADAQAAVEPQAEPVEPVEVEQVDEPARGRGRPRKAVVA